MFYSNPVTALSTLATNFWEDVTDSLSTSLGPIEQKMLDYVIKERRVISLTELSEVAQISKPRAFVRAYKLVGAKKLQTIGLPGNTKFVKA